MLALADLKGMDEPSLKNHLIAQYTASAEWLEDAQILIAYESVGSYGCDSSSFFLLKKRGEFYEIHGSHCSCYGFEDQFDPEKTQLPYLKSHHFSFSTGGYDDDDEKHRNLVSEFLQNL